MSEFEKSWLKSPERRKALARLAGFMAASPIGAAMAQLDPTYPLSGVRRVPTLKEMQTAFDFEPVFKGNLIQSVYEYTSHGDGSEFNLRRNRQAFEWVDIVPRGPAIPASQVDLSSELFGVKMKFPILVSPSSGQNALHPEGEPGMYKGAAAAGGMIDILASGNPASIEKARAAAPGAAADTVWAQYYPNENLTNAQRSLEGVQTAGVSVIAVTVDEQASVYERTLMVRNLGGRAVSELTGGANSAAAAAERAAAAGGAVPGSVRYRVSDRRLWYTWQYMDALRKMVKGKLLVKGIVDAEDAKIAVQHGMDGIIVSNHGGRSMDYGPATLEVLPEIIAAVNGKIPVLIDSGFRRGADVFKALAMGAKGVCFGKAARWGLGAYGSAGAQRVFEIIQQELIQTAAAAGCAKLSDINKFTIKVNFV